MTLLLRWMAVTTLACSPAAAGPADELARALRLDDIVTVMAAEGAAQGADLDAKLLGGAGGAGWANVVADIYAVPPLTEQVTGIFTAEMDEVEAARLLDFFGTERGAMIVDLEIAARRALLDPDIEAAPGIAVRDLPGPRLDRIEAFVEANDLVDRNVAGAMNASVAFYTALSGGDAYGGALDGDAIIHEVWSQEPEIRRDTRDWLLAYLNVAFAPLDDADLDAYLELSAGPGGQAMNAALFQAFGAMFEDVSMRLGQAAAGFMRGSEL